MRIVFHNEYGVELGINIKADVAPKIGEIVSFSSYDEEEYSGRGPWETERLMEGEVVDVKHMYERIPPTGHGKADEMRHFVYVYVRVEAGTVDGYDEVEREAE